MKVVLPPALAAAVLLSSAQLGVDGVSLRGESSSLGALSLDLAAVTVPPPPTVSVQPVTQGPMTTTTTFHPTTPSATFDDPTTPSATFDDPTTPLPHSWTTAHASTTSAAPTTTKQGIFGSISRIFFKKKPKKATVEGLNAKLRILREKIEESKTQMKSAHEEGRKRVEALVTIADKEVQMLHQKGTEIDKRSAANFRKLKEVMLEEIKDARNKVKKEQEANKKYLNDFKRAAVAELDKVRKEMNDVKSHSDKYLETLKGAIAAELTNVNKKVNAKVEGFGKIVDEMITEKLRSTNHRLAELKVGTNDAIKSSAASFQLSLNELQQKWTESANKFSKQMQAKFQLQIAEATGKIAQNQETEKRMWEEIALLKKEIARLSSIKK